MSMLEVVPYYRLPRDETGKTAGLDKRDIQNALRWWPPCRDDEGEDGKGHAYGYRALKQLAEGDTISSVQRVKACLYLNEAIAYYKTNPWGDSAMRDNEPIAIEELTIVKTLLT